MIREYLPVGVRYKSYIPHYILLWPEKYVNITKKYFLSLLQYILCSILLNCKNK